MLDDMAGKLGAMTRPFAEALARTEERICWKCKKDGATIRTAPQPPDIRAWWFHTMCYWELQDLLY